VNRDRLAAVVAEYIDRVVNRRDITAVDDLVSHTYRGSGHEWPTDQDGLRTFYEEQYQERPDWRIDLQETVELATSVVARAVAGGRIRVAGGWRQRRVEWLAHYRVLDGRIVEINLLDVVQLETDEEAL
jgi:hypothetical protein